TLVEKDRLGGVCLNVGCIPTKTLLRSCEIFSLFQKSEEFAIKSANVKIDIQALMERKKRIVQRLVGGVEYLLKKNKVNVIKGEAEFTGPQIIKVSGEKEVLLKAEKIIIATGSLPASIPLEGVENEAILTSTDALNIEKVPENLLIIGAGAIGVEFASIYSTLGSKVTLVEMLPRILPGEDAEISEKLKQIMQKKGIEILTESIFLSAKKEGEKYRAFIKTPSGEKEITFNKVLLSVGRKPNSHNLGLDKAQVETDEKGWIKVNRRMQTTNPSIFACGDITGGYLLAHVAYAEGEVAAENAMGEKSEIDYRVVPRFVCSMPEIAAVGLTEEQVKEKKGKFKVGRCPFIANGKALIYGEREGMVKIICDAETEEILGVHILGPQATDLILEGTIAMSIEGTVEDIISTIHPHPALGETIREAALSAKGRAIHL
ncbi:dihydrolipoyl dehydrogenase, partial [Candidatus Aerophobetes bacterium]|nr:dihydrolipoyl dehydrogenase [Candidatus Aerophobetes bacterium]